MAVTPRQARCRVAAETEAAFLALLLAGMYDLVAAA